MAEQESFNLVSRTSVMMATPTYDKYKMEGEFVSDGVLYFAPMVTQEYLDDLKTWKADPSDVILAAYPKTGKFGD
jgi:hypothetical protein